MRFAELVARMGMREQCTGFGWGKLMGTERERDHRGTKITTNNSFSVIWG
jgi:hypothetical protein